MVRSRDKLVLNKKGENINENLTSHMLILINVSFK